MKLSKLDRVSLINQYKILAVLNKDEQSYYEELIEILENGYEIFYSLIDSWISDDMSEADGSFVIEILNLYRAIEDVKGSSGNAEIIAHPYSFFHGFDGNNEAEYLVFSRFLIEKQGKFREQVHYFSKNDNLNSHMPMKDKYKRMLNAAQTIDNIWNLSVQEALTILNA